MYYLLRDKDGEAYCAIVIPEAKEDGGTVWLETNDMRINIGDSRVYNIKQKDTPTSIFFTNLGTVTVDWDSEDRSPFHKRNGVMLNTTRVLLEELTKAQFETYVLLGLKAVTREEQNPFNILATMDI